MTRTLVITGASSGIGRALALHYASDGAMLGLIGRDKARLQAVADECTKRGAKVKITVLDVCDRTKMTQWLEEFDRSTPVDLVIANAGLMTGTPPGGDIENSQAGYDVIETNVLGVLNTVQPLLPRMVGRRSGQIAILSSLSAFIALPDSPSYCASKAAVLAYGRSLRALLAPCGIGVSVICPGYVTTPMMLREAGSKPLVVSAERAVGIISSGLRSNRAVIAFPTFLVWAIRLHNMLPDWLQRRILRNSRFTVVD
jgi:short-subunit dehydrogenase